MSKEKSTNMAAIKMPKQHMDFIRRNPKLSQMYGTIVVSISNTEDMLKKLKGLLDETDEFQQFLEDGTKEELDKFVVAIKDQIQSVLTLRNLSEEQIQEVQQKFKDAEIDVLVTKCDLVEKEDVIS